MPKGGFRMVHADAADRLESVLIAPDTPLSEALARLDRAGTGVLLLTDDSRMLLGTLTDGDVRRAILAGGSLEQPVGQVASRTPLTAAPTITATAALEIMDRGREFVVNHLPMVGSDGRVAGLLMRSDLVTAERPALSAVIMAGGLGTRLRPLTERMPKPMLPVGNRPLLELTIERLRAAGIRRVDVTTHYLADRISDHFGDGRAFGVDLSYVTEDQPLGTAGSLKFVQDRDDPVLVLNGDILTEVPIQGMLAFHRETQADITVGVRRYEMQVPYGVLECLGVRVCAVREKPVHRFLVNAGVYLVEPSAARYIPEGTRFDMTDLLQRLIDNGRTVASFPIMEYWLDIGRQADYEQAQMDVSNGTYSRAV